jgi:hypothetical protein
MDGWLRTPGRIPQKVQMIREDEAPPALSSGAVIGGVPGEIPGGQLGGVGGIISSTSTVSAVPKLAVPAAPQTRPDFPGRDERIVDSENRTGLPAACTSGTHPR